MIILFIKNRNKQTYEKKLIYETNKTRAQHQINTSNNIVNKFNIIINTKINSTLQIQKLAPVVRMNRKKPKFTFNRCCILLGWAILFYSLLKKR
jgi:hypothetical protein